MKDLKISDEDLVRCITKFDDLRIDSLYKDKEGLDHIFTQEFEDKMDDIIYKEDKHFSLKNTNRLIVGICIMVVCIGTMSLSVDAVRVKVIQIIEEIRVEFTNLMFYKDKNNSENEIIEPENNMNDVSTLPIPQYIPDGFNEINRLESTLDTIIIYQSNDGVQIRYSVSPIDNNTITLDTEDATTEELYIGEYKAKYIEKNDIRQVFWNDSDYIYLVDCNSLDKKELIKIVENVKK